MIIPDDKNHQDVFTPNVPVQPKSFRPGNWWANPTPLPPPNHDRYTPPPRNEEEFAKQRQAFADPRPLPVSNDGLYRPTPLNGQINDEFPVEPRTHARLTTEVKALDFHDSTPVKATLPSPGCPVYDTIHLTHIPTVHPTGHDPQQDVSFGFTSDPAPKFRLEVVPPEAGTIDENGVFTASESYVGSAHFVEPPPVEGYTITRVNAPLYTQPDAMLARAGELGFDFAARERQFPDRPDKPTCLVTLSGGIDSTVLVHQLVDDGEYPLCVYIDYGTRCREAEIRAAQATCTDLQLELVVLPLPVYKDIASAFILGNSDEVNRGSMFWLEGRNAVIGLLLAVMASGRGMTEVYVGINYSDNAGEYVDTDAKFIAALNMLIMCSMRNEVTVHAPWIANKMNKAEVIEAGNDFNIDWVRTTHSCSSSIGDAPPCCDYVNCESCKSRLEDFEAVDMQDPFATAACEAADRETE